MEMKELICLNCSKIIVLEGDPSIGQTVLCPNCDAYFEITHLSPIVLDWAFEDDDDYDDDDDDYDEELDEEYLKEEPEVSEL